MTNIRSKTTSFESLLIKWELPISPNSNILNYIVYYTNSSFTQPRPISDEGYTSIVTDSTQTASRTVEITGLMPFTNYTVHIRAVGDNPSLQGAVLEEIRMRTNITNPTPIRDLRAVALSSESIKVTWSPPEAPNGPISHYIVYYAAGSIAQTSGIISNTDYKEQRTPDARSEIDIAGLIPYTNYTFQVEPVVTEMPYVLTGPIEKEIVRRTNSTVPPTPTTGPTQSTIAEPTHETINVLIPDPLQIQTGRVMYVVNLHYLCIYRLQLLNSLDIPNY